MRNKFPIFVDNPDLIYLDNAATSQKPKEVLDSIHNFYSTKNATVRRALYDLSESATKAYEEARSKVASFINADSSEVAFTKGTTDGINLIALSWGEKNISEGDEIVVTEFEHHSNFVPWQQLAKRKKAKLVVVPVSTEGKIEASGFKNFISEKTKLVAVSQSSNVLNINLDVKEIARLAHSVGAKVLIDAAQSIMHQKVDVKDIDCNFLVFSAHKMFGPTGIGALFIKKDILDQVEPVEYGGGMVLSVGLDSSSFIPTIHKLEAGTPAIAQAIGFGAAVDFIKKNINFQELRKHELSLCKKLIDGLKSIKGVKILGTDNYTDSGHLVSFIMQDFHPHDISAYLNRYNICVRAGHHCAQPLHRKLGIDASVRVSFAAYNNLEEVEALLLALNQLQI